MPTLRRLLLIPLLTLLLGACTPIPVLRVQAEQGTDPWREVRLGYVEVWAGLRRGPLSGLERFSRLVQHVADDALARSADPESVFAGIDPLQLFLDDLVDLFVPDDFRDEKGLIMASEPLLVGEVIVEGSGDLSGFRPELQAGDGRYRHFAMNAAAASRFPPFLVDAAARWIGGDIEDGRELSADSQADIATNEIGRAFAERLREVGLAAFADGDGIERWMLERFGP
jgi:hypothetical protein